MDGELGRISPDCVTSLEEQNKYVGTSNILVMFNQVHFYPDRFGEKAIERNSMILNKQFDQLKPSWLKSTIQQTELQDETDFVQFGYDDSTEFLTFSN